MITNFNSKRLTIFWIWSDSFMYCIIVYEISKNLLWLTLHMNMICIDCKSNTDSEVFFIKFPQFLRKREIYIDQEMREFQIIKNWFGNYFFFQAVCTKCGIDTFNSNKQQLWLCKICSEYREVIKSVFIVPYIKVLFLLLFILPW